MPTVRRSACGPMGPGDARRPGGRRDVPVHGASFHAGTGPGAQQGPGRPAVDGGLHRRERRNGDRDAGGFVALAQDQEGGVAADGAEGLHGQAGHLGCSQAHHAAEHRDRVVGRPQVASGGQEGGVLEDGEYLAALQFSLDLGSGDAGARVGGDRAPPHGPGGRCWRRRRSARRLRRATARNRRRCAATVRRRRAGRPADRSSVGAPPAPAGQVGGVGPLCGWLETGQPPGGQVIPSGIPGGRRGHRAHGRGDRPAPPCLSSHASPLRRDNAKGDRRSPNGVTSRTRRGVPERPI